MTSQQQVSADRIKALTMEQRAISELLPHPRNYRRHPEHQLTILRESLRVHGQQKPVVITPDGTILAGPSRLSKRRDSNRGRPLAEARGRFECHGSPWARLPPIS